MQVVARTQSGASHKTDHLALLDRIALVPVNTGQVCVTCLEAEAVGYDHRFAISRHVPLAVACTVAAYSAAISSPA